MKNITVVTNLNGKTACIKTMVNNTANAMPELKGMGFSESDILAVFEGHIINIISPVKGFMVDGVDIIFSKVELELLKSAKESGGKLTAIKVMREMKNLGLKESKELVERMEVDGCL